MGYRSFTASVRLYLTLFAVPDIAAMVYYYSDPSANIFVLALWALRPFTWIVSYPLVQATNRHSAYSLVSIASIVVYAIQGGSSLPGLSIVMYSLYPIYLLIFCCYTDNWTRPVPVSGKSDPSAARLVTVPPYDNPRGRRYWCQEFGNPEHPVLMCYAGMPTSTLAMAPIIDPLLVMGYFVVLMEYPGTGNGRGEKFSLGELAKRTEEYVMKLQPRPDNGKVILYGVSGGGNAVLYMAGATSQAVRDRISAVVSVVPVAPGSAFSFNPSKSIMFHPLSLNTKMQARFTNYASVAKPVVSSEFLNYAKSMIDTDAKWHPNLTLDGSDLFHDPELLAKRWFQEGGPFEQGKEQLTKASKLLTTAVERGLDWERTLAPEIYGEYVAEYCKGDCDGAVAKITCPVIFFGGKGGPATGTFDGFKPALPSSTKMEMVIANIENAGTGGKNAHLSMTTFWRRHLIVMDDFLTNADVKGV